MNTSFAYSNPSSNVPSCTTRRHDPDGTTPFPTYEVVERDPFRRGLVTGCSTYHGGTPVDSYAYAYDAGGRPVSRNGDSFGYDARGTNVFTHAYDDFGRAISQAGPLADVFRHRFSSKCFDVETGLYYYGRRFYSPVLRRWLNRDPLEEDGGLNLYMFCSNCPQKFYDMLGMFDDGYVEVCVEEQGGWERDERGVSHWVTHCVKTKRISANYKGHFQFKNNGTNCPFDYTAEDHDITTSPYTPWVIKGHFSSRGVVLGPDDANVMGAVNSCDPDAFASIMHRLQDTRTHYDRGSRVWTLGHLLKGSEPDHDELSQTKAWDLAEADTVKYVEMWMQSCRLKDPCHCIWERR